MKLIEWARAKLSLHPSALRGAGGALTILGWTLAVASFLVLAVPDLAWERALGVGAGIAMAIAAALLVLGLIWLLRRGPLRFWWGALLTASMLAISFGIVISPKGFAILLVAVLVSTGMLGGGLAMLRANGSTRARVIATWVGAVGVVSLATMILLPGWNTHDDRTWQPQTAIPLDLPNPGAKGSLTVHALTYGSGQDLHRAEYGAKADLVTEPVDGSHLIEGWSGPAGWTRTRYWGFDATHLPLQGRVWFPDGDGAFPLVLMVHGNHNMEDFSDSGYAYLGELFASRGIIAVSVDENFLNSSFTDLLGGFDGGLKKENDARGWLLLEHLRQWRQWNLDPQNRFFGKVDLDHVALIGHSRGGEAVAIAALFNRLPFFPDDARVKFDYGFNLRGVIAVAPSDAQYEPRGRPTELDGVSYLVIQGSHDGDVQSFMGSAQYSRTLFDDCERCFKAGIYIDAANHGQFNTGWGRDDLGGMWGRMLNLTTIMDPAAQRRVAEAVFGAFMEVVLHERDEYRAFFANPATGLVWLGSDVQFVNEYAAADEVPLANFEEDDDLTTGSSPGVRLVAVDLARWYEILVGLKWFDLDSEVALVGWNRTDDKVVPELRFDIADATIPSGALSFSLAMSDKSPLEEDATWTPPKSIDFHVEVADRDGHDASVVLSSVQSLYAPIKVTTRKFAVLDGVDPSEPVFQRYTIPFDRFPGVDPTRLASIRFRFDVTPAGALYLDDVAAAPR